MSSSPDDHGNIGSDNSDAYSDPPNLAVMKWSTYNSYKISYQIVCEVTGTEKKTSVSKHHLYLNNCRKSNKLLFLGKN